MTEEHLDRMPGWASLALRIVDGVSFDGPGRKVLKVYRAVNFHKIATGFLILGIMTFFAFLPWFNRKDLSLSRHPGRTDYKSSTGLLVPLPLFNGRAWTDMLRGNDESGHAVTGRGS